MVYGAIISSTPAKILSAIEELKLHNLILIPVSSSVSLMTVSTGVILYMLSPELRSILASPRSITQKNQNTKTKNKT